MSQQTREEHMAWCKQRALQYLDTNDLTGAWASMASDLTKHPDTANHPGLMIGMMLMMKQELSTPEKMRKFIEDFA